MPDATDLALVREYARCNSESAFAELVRRHVNLVYSVALRFTVYRTLIRKFFMRISRWRCLFIEPRSKMI